MRALLFLTGLPGGGASVGLDGVSGTTTGGDTGMAVSFSTSGETMLGELSMYGNWSGGGALCSAGILGIISGETPGCVNVAHNPDQIETYHC